MPQTVEIFVSPSFQESFTRLVGGLPRGIRFARSIERSQVVVDHFEDSDRHLLARALLEARATALVTDSQDPCSVSANSIISALIDSLGKKKRPLLMVAPAQAAMRLALARLNKAEAKLIAHAALVGDEIRVWSCEPRAYQCPVTAIKALARLPREQLGQFEVSTSGSHLHWPAADIDLGLDDFREACDPNFAREQQQRVAEDLLRYGQAIRSLRTEKQLRQGGIEGLSERELRRIEQGKHSPQVDTLRKLARAHGMPLKSYLDALAERC